MTKRRQRLQRAKKLVLAALLQRGYSEQSGHSISESELVQLLKQQGADADTIELALVELEADGLLQQDPERIRR